MHILPYSLGNKNAKFKQNSNKFVMANGCRQKFATVFCNIVQNQQELITTYNQQVNHKLI